MRESIDDAVKKASDLRSLAFLTAVPHNTFNARGVCAHKLKLLPLRGLCL